MIRNLIFDVGSVLIGYRWKEMLTDDFGADPAISEDLGRAIFDDPIWNDFDRGVCDEKEAVDHYCRRFPEHEDLLRRFFDEAERMLVKRETVWDRIAALKEKGYKIYILSNYSEYLFKKHTDGLPFIDLADGAVVSYEIGMLKPEKGIYEHLLEKYGLLPEECIFYDDRSVNVEGAKALGIESYLITSEEDLLEKIGKL